MGLAADLSDVEFGPRAYYFLAVFRQLADGYLVDHSIYVPAVILVKVSDVLGVQKGVC